MKNQRGQTLLEVIIAIFIMVFGIISIVSLAVMSSAMSRSSTHELVATNIAREGIEVVRNKRDSNWLSIEKGDNINLYDGLHNAQDYTAILEFVPGASDWFFHFQPDNISNNPAKMHLDTDNIYIQRLNVGITFRETPYRRLISMFPICDNGSEYIVAEGASCAAGQQIGIQVISHVQWQESGDTKDKILEEKMYDWKY